MKNRQTIRLVMAMMLMSSLCLPIQAEKPNSKFGGVQVGAITYSFRSMPQDLSSVLQQSLDAGLSSVELMGGPVEEYAGIPTMTMKMPPRGTEITQEQRDAFRAEWERVSTAQKEWRKSASLDKFVEVKKMFDEAGVNIDILKLGDPNWSDEEIDYAFTVAKTLGARGITFEIGEKAAERMAPFAEKHNMLAIMHNHGQPGQPDFSFDKMLSYGKNLMLNFDIGHYWGCTGKNPAEIVAKYHDRIASVHIKDKTGLTDTPKDTNRPFGQGSTPIADVLKLIQKNKWNITADIELEYEIPAGSDAVAETKKCVEYCKSILTL